MTDSRSMYDFLNKRGSTPSDKRLRLYLEMIRDEMDDEGLRVKWVSAKHQLADALTKGSLDAAIYVMLVAETAVFALTDDERLSTEVAEFRLRRRMEEKEARNRRRKALAEHKRLQKPEGKAIAMQPRGGDYDEDGDVKMMDDRRLHILWWFMVVL